MEEQAHLCNDRLVMLGQGYMELSQEIKFPTATRQIMRGFLRFDFKFELCPSENGEVLDITHLIKISNRFMAMPL